MAQITTKLKKKSLRRPQLPLSESIHITPLTCKLNYTGCKNKSQGISTTHLKSEKLFPLYVSNLHKEAVLNTDCGRDVKL